MSLFKFKNPDSFRINEKNDENEIVYGADIIEPNATNINVVLDYEWTINPKSSRKDVPYVYLIERKLTNDVMLQQLAYNVKAIYESSSEVADAASDGLKQIISKVMNDSSTDLSDRDIGTTIQKIEDFVGVNNNPEEPYRGLYSLEDTGWSYILPYFDKQNHNIGGSWGLPEESGGFNSVGANISNQITSAALSINQIMNMVGALNGEGSARPGTYIERAKQYKFESNGPSYVVSFNLYNTGKIDDVIKNWELCFAFMYNLLPNRRTKTIIDPPPLYEVHIPGVRRSPVSFISGLRVDFLGATRIMDLDVAGMDKVRTIVPDAYSINLTIEDVLPESKNFLLSMLKEEKRIKVTNIPETLSRSYNVDALLSNDINDITYISLNSNGSIKRVGGVLNPSKEFANQNIAEPLKRVSSKVSSVVKGVF